MPEVATRIRDYYDSAAEPVTVEEILSRVEGPEPVRPVLRRIVPRSVPRWVYGIAAGAVLLLLVGGVASNKLLRQQLAKNSPIPVLVPEPVLCTDNAAMIAACGYYQFQAGKTNGLDLDVVASLKLA